MCSLRHTCCSYRRAWHCCQWRLTFSDVVILLPRPGRGTAYCFRTISFFVSLSATLRENGWTDLHEIFREGVEWPWDDLIKFWVNSGKRVGGSTQRSICLLSPATAQRTGVNKSESFARWQQEPGFVVPRITACFILFFILIKSVGHLSKLCHSVSCVLSVLANKHHYYDHLYVQ